MQNPSEQDAEQSAVYEVAQVLLRAIREQRSGIVTSRAGGKFDVLTTHSEPDRCEAKIIGTIDVLALARAVLASRNA